LVVFSAAEKALKENLGIFKGFKENFKKIFVTIKIWEGGLKL
jgi:hypothetical protein